MNAINHRASRLTAALATLATVAVVAAPSVRADAPADPGSGFVLLSMEQARLFSGMDSTSHACTDTGQYNCTGPSGGSCANLSWESCADITNYANSTIHYCIGFGTGTGTCLSGPLVLCYTTLTCVQTDNGRCAWWSDSPQNRYDDTCVQKSPPPPPPGGT